MPIRYTDEQRTFILNTFIECNRSVAVAQRKWRSKFRNTKAPTRNTYISLDNKFSRTGSVSDDVAALATKRITVRTPENIIRVDEAITANRNISLQQLSLNLDIGRESTRLITREDLTLHPYKIQTHQELTDKHKKARLTFAQTINEMIDNSFDPKLIIFTDEAHFHLDGYVNKQNYRYWGTEKPTEFNIRTHTPERITVWAGLTNRGVIGPFLIESSVDASVYEDILHKAIAQLEDDDYDLSQYWWQQDGATCHATKDNLQLLNDFFQDRVISRRFPDIFNQGLEWPACSPDCSLLDFFFWGYVKDQVYKNRPTTISELEDKVISTIENVTLAMIHNAYDNFVKRMKAMKDNEGGHFEGIM